MSRRQSLALLAGCCLILALEAPRLFISLQATLEGAYPAWDPVDGRVSSVVVDGVGPVSRRKGTADAVPG